MPHPDDNRHQGFGVRVHVCRLVHEPSRLPYQPKVFGRHDPGSFLERPRVYETFQQRHRRSASAPGTAIGIRIEQPMQVHDEGAQIKVFPVNVVSMLPA